MNTKLDEFLLQAYLNRELDAQAEREYEIALIRNPKLAELAMADAALLAGLTATPATASGLAQVPSSNDPGPQHRASSRATESTRARPIWPLAIVASFTALLAGTLGYALRPAEIYGGASLIYLDKQRSTSAQLEIALPSEGPLLLMVPVASSQPCRAEIRVEQASAVLVFNATPDAYGIAPLILPGNALKPGPVNIQISCDGQALGSFEATAVRRP